MQHTYCNPYTLTVFAVQAPSPDGPKSAGASLSLLLHTDTHPDLVLPEKFVKGSVGKGLGGNLERL